MSYLIAVDVGTSSTKTALRDAGGRLLAEATAEYPVHRPYPAWAEMDVEEWWQATCTTIRQVIAKAGIDARTVRGIGMDGGSPRLRGSGVSRRSRGPDAMKSRLRRFPGRRRAARDRQDHR